ncbi:group I truncated hemoglobin [Hazenella coriacea]|uniref:Hemoglobin n=1 Tax=Hazenella coriacea TaxID=1179467 RepID=A0A4R3L7I4_9BACL|nr:group 1 truncated hemoglobin [Hazenella coriacea]TCS94920.1 hemoglobin [Hazenella coriacea]
MQGIKSDLYERIGGEQAITAVVNEFYGRLLEDDRISHHFEGKNMRRLMLNQITFFISYAVGGPKRYTGGTLRRSHEGLDITFDEYEIFLKHLSSSFRKFNVPIADIAKIEAFVRTLKPHIIEK